MTSKRVTGKTIKDRQICEMRDMKPVNDEHRALWIACVRALGVDPVAGRFVGADVQQCNREICAGHWNALMTHPPRLCARQGDARRRQADRV